MNLLRQAVDDKHQALELAANLAQALILLALPVYFVGWCFLNVLYQDFGIDPAQLGLDFLWIVERAIAVLMLAIAVVILLFGFAFARESGLRSRAADLVLLVGVAATAGTVLSLLTIDRLSLASILLAGLSTVVVIVLATASPGLIMRRPTLGGGFRRLLRRTSLSVLILAVLVLPWVGAAAVSDGVRQGHSQDIDLGIGLPLLTIDRVKVTFVGTVPPPPGLLGDCLFLLGDTDGGTTYLFDRSHDVLRQVPTTQVVVTVLNGSC
ncbi:hypothetical protein Q0Z83_056680 [Actinoplanes sichuanensis]|uniref:Uncharacterized protein n=1 Tax=Actinoplanes sichuanensis TaxID=512349 RepID=A0ABW4A517_9ACTN|nr:hypothetical protein [Actinoplanes sichuanensis]BEL07477.1 hypothetical protein Q0Z83_056680 [Actinoplanes sichuanensis]